MTKTNYLSFYQHLVSNHKDIAFDRIPNTDFTQALTWAIEQADKAIDTICMQKSAPSFQNTIVALEQTGREVDAISSLFFNLFHADTNPVLQSQVASISSLLSTHQNGILLNDVLFSRVLSVYEDTSLSLNDEDKRLLEQTYKGFASNGAMLSSTNKAKLRHINSALAQLGPAFSKNVLEDTNAFTYFTDDEAKLDGIPQHVLDNAKQLATSQGKHGWCLTLHAPCYLPVMQYAHNRSLRAKLFKARGALALGGERCNKANIKRIVSLRQQKAQLLGHDFYADYVLTKRMAKNTDTVDGFLDELESKYRLAALSEFSELETFAQKEGVDTLQAWDIAYYSNKLKLSTLDFDEEALRPYFRHDRVLEGMFLLATKLYGLQFTLDTNVAVYHEEVMCYRVTDADDNYTATLYVDLYPRASKNQGAWMTTWKTQHVHNEVDQRPIISMVCNFTPKNDKGYAFFTFDEVETLFHEFGHALHAACSNVTYGSLASPNVYWDFVELPSQIMENFLQERKVLDLFAQHNETGQAIDAALLEKIQKRSQFQTGLQGLRQLSLARLDMAWHSVSEPCKDVLAFEETILSEYRMVEPVAHTSMSTQFSHIFAGGYAAGYYSYKWAEVLDADAFSYFKKYGVLNATIAKSFRDTVLALGNTVDPHELYQRFRKAPPTSKALFEREGI